MCNSSSFGTTELILSNFACSQLIFLHLVSVLVHNLSFIKYSPIPVEPETSNDGFFTLKLIFLLLFVSKAKIAKSLSSYSKLKFSAL